MPITPLKVCVCISHQIPARQIQLVRVSFRGETYLYCPFIYTDAEAPMAAGREVWGWPKKMADLKFAVGQSLGEGDWITVDGSTGNCSSLPSRYLHGCP